MVVVKKLYGVSDSGYIRGLEGVLILAGISLPKLFGDPTGSVITHVGSGLRDELMSLPKGTRVGVQYFEELCDGGVPYRRSLRVKNTSVYVPEHIAGYWGEILGICKLRGLEAIFLDDYKIFREIAKKLVQKEMKTEEIKNMEINNPQPKVEIKKIIQALKEEIYTLDVEMEHLQTEKKGDKILENIIHEQPGVAILGAGHADYFIANPQLMEMIKVKFEKYAREQYSEKINLSELPTYMRKLPHVFGKLINNAEPNKVSLADREMVERRYKAITLGRIIASKEPAWIGTWDVDIPARGLFEIYVEDEIKTFHGVTAIKGRVEDTYGSATFFGSIGDETLIFQKDYDEMARSAGADILPMLYETPIRGETVEGLPKGVYRGHFTTKDSKKPFYIREFSEEDPKLEKFRRN